MVKLLITCLIVGERSAFQVEVDDGDKVAILKDKVKEKYANKLAKVAAPDLQLFLARVTNPDGWLDEAGAVAVALNDDGMPSNYKDPMCGARILKSYFGADFCPGDSDIHVLVVVPTRESIRELFAMLREDRVRVERLERQVEESEAALKHKESKFGSLTDRELGQTTKQRLEKHGLIFEFAPTEDGEAFWVAFILVLMQIRSRI